jgi:hypothetical protein
MECFGAGQLNCAQNRSAQDWPCRRGLLKPVQQPDAGLISLQLSGQISDGVAMDVFPVDLAAGFIQNDHCERWMLAGFVQTDHAF